MEITGKIRIVNPTQQVSAQFKKREIVVTTNEQYPQHILIEFNQDRVDLLDPYNVGEEVKVSINIRGREWVNPQGEVKYFNSIQGWRIERLQSEYQAPQNSQPQYAPPQYQAPTQQFSQEEPDDLPF